MLVHNQVMTTVTILADNHLIAKTESSFSVSSSEVNQRLRQWLTDLQVPFRQVQHEPTLTSEESAKARSEPLEIGGKALLLKAADQFRLVVMPAHLKLDSGLAKQAFEVKKLRFARQQELLERTGLVPGSVPPFGHPILPFDLYVDEAILANQKIAFNAGLLTESFVMAMEDYLRIANGRLVAVSCASP